MEIQAMYSLWAIVRRNSEVGCSLMHYQRVVCVYSVTSVSGPMDYSPAFINCPLSVYKISLKGTGYFDLSLYLEIHAMAI